MSIYPKLEHIIMQSSSEGMSEFDTAADDSSHRLKHIREIKRRLENEQENGWVCIKSIVALLTLSMVPTLLFLYSVRGYALGV